MRAELGPRGLTYASYGQSGSEARASRNGRGSNSVRDEGHIACASRYVASTTETVSPCAPPEAVHTAGQQRVQCMLRKATAVQEAEADWRRYHMIAPRTKARCSPHA